MRQILSLAFGPRGQRLLISVTLVIMILLTFASQLEIFAFGVITRKGPDVFEVFAPITEGKLQPGDEINFPQVEERWNEIMGETSKPLTLKKTERYLARTKETDFVGRVMGRINFSDDLTHLAYFLLFVAFFKAITLFGYRFLNRLVAIRISRDLRQDYFEHIQALPMSFYSEYNMGTLSTRVVGDAAMVAEAVNASLINYIQTPFTIVTTLTICFLTSWQLSLIVFIGMPLILFPIFSLAKRVKRVSRQIQVSQDRFASVILDFLAGIQTVKMFGMEGYSLKKYQEHNNKMAQLEIKSARYDLSTRPIVHTLGMFFLAVALIYGLYVLQMSVSEVLFYCGLLYVFYEPIKKFAEENSHIQRGIAAAERIREVMDLKPEIHDHDGAVACTSFQDSIRFEDVWFKYGDEWVLRGVSFTVKKGQTVAIVGPTGSGKSTIVQLLPRLYEPQRGKILFDGKSLEAYTQASLRDQMAFVPQRPVIFLDTVAENISFGRPHKQEEIEQAAVSAHADEFIQRLPLKYQTELSEMGKNLSGGQQQRLAIARALFKKAPLLVMDEATSSLDAMSEHMIKTAIEELHGKVTQIIIAHRLSTIEDADVIFYLEKGTLIAQGSKQELMQTCSGFKRMWELMHANP